ncbi:PCI domain containing protein [Nitzschia inconspicua]|uniref:PCI domain containing protein n=1 Tax=Nitzschia inconspicua TaxID=303405 RepID=A0A9K3KUZ0_9STRA|nr:PCI domain containing protein [Nitzschia inconspicua]
MVNIQAKTRALQEALVNQNATQVATALELPPIVIPSSSSSMPTKHKQQSLIIGDVDYGSLLTSLLDATAAVEMGDAEAAAQAQLSLHKTFNQIFGSSEGNWLVPALIVVCKTTNRMANAADYRLSSKNRSKPQQRANLQKAVPIMQDSYSKTFNDRTEFQPGAPFDSVGSKKAGVLAIVNVLFGMYFRLNILRLCKNLIRPVEGRKLNETGTMADMVTYNYYIGRLNMFEDQHDKAEVCLDYALQHCHKDAVHNKKCILKYLVPVKLYRGRLPSMRLLDKYGLEEFKPLVDGIEKGDLRTFQDGLVKYQDGFIRQGTYLMLEKCKTVCYRNLFKRVHIIMQKHQISLHQVANAFKWLGMPMDLDEIECIMANLIFRGYVRGYLSHQKRVLVLSKRDPFPTSSVIRS